MYRIEISTDPSFSTLVYNETVDTTGFVPPTGLADARYFWRVKGFKIAAADSSDYSEVRTFRVGEPCCLVRRGNANGDESDDTNISDITFLVDYLFGVPLGDPPSCMEEGNVNGDSGGAINISDITFLVDFLFGVPLGDPPPNCPF